MDSHQRMALPRSSGVLVSLGVGITLGVGAVVADILSGPVAQLLQGAFSTGLAWGAGAVYVGYRARSSLHAAILGAGALVIATIVYYGAIVGFDLRAGVGLPSILRVTAVWTAGSVVGGTMCGSLGYGMRYSSVSSRSVMWGITCGLLATPGINDAIRGWSYLFNDNARAVLLSTVTLILLPVVVLLAALWHDRILRPSLSVSMAFVTAPVGVLLWNTILRLL